MPYLGDRVAPNFRTLLRERQPLIWLLAAIIGVAVAYAVLLFLLVIGGVQNLWLDHAGEETVATLASGKPWWLIIAAPTLAGLLVGLFLTYALPRRRADGVADVIEARAIGGARIDPAQGLGSALVSAVSLGAGASAGREGPAVHLGATLASWLAHHFKLEPMAYRALLGCGAAAAVSASFNAPIAGVLFALEVILGHYALRAFIPIVVSSVCATIVTRIHSGDEPVFQITEYAITSYWEFPAFLLLGLTCGLVAICFQFAVMGTDWTARRITCPLWLRPVIGGFAIGVLGVFLPEILGVGYEATNHALRQDFTLLMLLVLLIAKSAATAITLASRFGGGVFSPSLYLGAMTGGAFGIIAASVFPDQASSHGLYAIVGMGAVSAAILGAPISTALIVFELTGDYAVVIALLLAISMSSGLMQAVHGQSLFHWQLSTRGLFLTGGPPQHIVRVWKVHDFMVDAGDDDIAEWQGESDDMPLLTPEDTLESALRAFDHSGRARVPVVSGTDTSKLVGWAEYTAALNTYNKALIAAHEEEHR
jgi:CIC family chloride channel protein